MEMNDVYLLEEEMESEEDGKEVFDQAVCPIKNLYSKLMAAMADDVNKMTEYLLKVISLDLSKPEAQDELVYLLGEEMDQEQAGQWAICYFRNLLPYCNYLDAQKKAIFLYLRLRTPHISIPVAESTVPSEIHNYIKRFQNSNRDDEFYKKIE